MIPIEHESPSWSLDLWMREGELFLARGRLDGPAPTGTLNLVLRDAAGQVIARIDANVIEATPDQLVFVACGSAPPAHRAAITLEAESDSLMELASIPLPTPEGNCRPERDNRWQDYAARAWQLMRAGRWSALREKADRYLRQGRAAPVTADNLAGWLSGVQGELSLMVDRGLGGGAGDYCRRRVTALVAAGDAALTVSPSPMGNGYVLTGEDSRGQWRGALADIHHDDVLSALGGRVGLLVYNTAAQFARPQALVAFMLRLKQASEARLEVLLHDYFPLCPSLCLLDNSGHYCGVPDLSQCRQCLPVNPHLPLSRYRELDVQVWRQWWGCLLKLADDIVTFSGASRDILQRAYPELDAEHVRVTPHQPVYQPERPARVETGQPLHIGILGQIGFHKGSAVVADLVRVIRERNLPVRITVIGSLEARCDPAVVRETGRYDHDNLVEVIEHSGVNLMLFPSIWPETFSYVVQEIMALQLPLACFDLGAQGERVSRYEKGLVLSQAGGDVILDHLLAFHRQLYPESAHL